MRNVVGKHTVGAHRAFLLNERGDLLILERRVFRGRMFAERCERLDVEQNWRPRLLALGHVRAVRKAAA